MYNHLEARIIVFWFRKSPSYLQRERVLFHGACHVEPACLYSSREWKNKILALERAFYTEVAASVGSPTQLEREGWGEEYSWLHSATSPLDATTSYTLVLYARKYGRHTVLLIYILWFCLSVKTVSFFRMVISLPCDIHILEILKLLSDQVTDIITQALQFVWFCGEIVYQCKVRCSE